MASLAMAAAFLLGGSTAHATSSPTAIVLKVPCDPRGIAGVADGALDCAHLKGWFDGHIDWVSGGVVLYSEKGPFHANVDGKDDFIEIYADGGNDPLAFGAFFDNAQSSLLTAPDLTLRLYESHKNKPDTLLTEQRYVPVASALWSKHCEDCIQLNAALGVLTGNLNNESTARKAADAQLELEIQSLGNGALNGDVTGPALANQVVGLRGVPIAASAATPGNQAVLLYDAALRQWRPKLLCQGIRQDCNDNAADGCETNVLTSAANCGCCGMPCPAAPNSTGACNLGACGVSCNPGFGDCDGMAANGCETSLATSANNCGACGLHCQPGQACVNGSCACGAGQAACPGGCANLQTDPANCGMCGNFCKNGPCVAGACIVQCAAPQVACNGVCTDVRSDPANCGGCNIHCMSPCINGACANMCPAPFVSCAGICVDVTRDVRNCGGCNLVCPAGLTCLAGACVNGCVPRSCAQFGFNCGLATDGCGGTLNCGTCPAGQACNANHCTAPATCADGIKNGGETDVDCGGPTCPRCALGHTCLVATDCATAICVGGVCGAPSCADGIKNGFETDVDCGGPTCMPCPNGKTCLANADCAAGICNANVCGGCPAGQTSCGGACVFLGSDVNNCGACGNVCRPAANAATGCGFGACLITCAAGFADCNRIAADGCEVSLQTDPRNCGGCGVACSLLQVCVAGACR